MWVKLQICWWNPDWSISSFRMVIKGDHLIIYTFWGQNSKNILMFARSGPIAGLLDTQDDVKLKIYRWNAVWSISSFITVIKGNHLILYKFWGQNSKNMLIFAQIHPLCGPNRPAKWCGSNWKFTDEIVFGLFLPLNRLSRVITWLFTRFGVKIAKNLYLRSYSYLADFYDSSS